MGTIHPIASDILTIVNFINKDGVRIGKKDPIFKVYDFSKPVYSCFEAGFIRSVSWLYVLYFETGKSSINFLIEKMEGLHLGKADATNHKSLVHCLRTNFQHSLDLSSERNVLLKQREENWFKKNINKVFPETGKDWEICLNILLEDAKLFFLSLQNCIQLISIDESASQMIKDWDAYCSHFHEPYEFDEIIFLVASDMGLDALDPVKHRIKFYDSWTKVLSNFNAEADFKKELMKLVQQSLLDSVQLPITTPEIKEKLGLKPGPEINQCLLKAREIYLSSLCTGDELIKRLIEIKDEGEKYDYKNRGA